MAYRPPKRLYLVNRWVEIIQVGQPELQDLFVDDPDSQLWGGWDDTTHTIYLLRSATPAKKARKLAHELVHAILDLLDPE